MGLLRTLTRQLTSSDEEADELYVGVLTVMSKASNSAKWTCQAGAAAAGVGAALAGAAPVDGGICAATMGVTAVGAQASAFLADEMQKRLERNLSRVARA